MSRATLRTLLEANGTFPDKDDVRANFEALFDLSERGQESTEDIAWAFAQALDQWSHVDATVDEAIAGRLRDWTFRHWSADSSRLCAALGGLLLNVPTPETFAFLTEQRARATDHDVQQALDELLADQSD